MTSPNILSDCRHPYCIGIGGIGVSAIARYLATTARPVHGSNPESTTVTRSLSGLPITVDLDNPQILPARTDLVVYSDAVPLSHPLRQDAQRRGIPLRSYAEALGELMAKFQDRVVVTGTNGKTTATAMLASILFAARRDPTVVVGSLAPQLDGNFHLGTETLGVCEGDEYLGHFLQVKPTLAIVTNIAMDHPDYFRDLEHVGATFHTFADQLPPDGTLILNADDEPSRRFLAESHRTATFSIGHAPATLHLTPLEIHHQRQQFSLRVDNQPVQRASLGFPGRYNLSNAAAAALGAWTLGISLEAIAKGLESFRGTWRRFEKIGEFRGAVVISDYAHHPAAVSAVIQAARDWFPSRRIIVVFQPHHRARLHTLVREFADALRTADAVVVTEAYDVLGREQKQDQLVSASELSRLVVADGPPTIFAPTLDEIPSAIQSTDMSNAVMLVLGAGSIDQWAREHLC